MERITVSCCHSLKIIPIQRLVRFARYGSMVVYQAWEEPADAQAVPGTVKVATSTDNGIIKKKITFYRSDVSAKTADMLQRYKASRIIATYIDESGQRRVAGSPDYPLSLDYIISDGVFSVTLEGEDTAHDAFIAD